MRTFGHRNIQFRGENKASRFNDAPNELPGARISRRSSTARRYSAEVSELGLLNRARLFDEPQTYLPNNRELNAVNKTFYTAATAPVATSYNPTLSRTQRATFLKKKPQKVKKNYFSGSDALAHAAGDLLKSVGGRARLLEALSSSYKLL
jgi:hypothetical protein